MFKQIDETTIINVDQVAFFDDRRLILKLTTGDVFRVDPELAAELKRAFGKYNVKMLS